MAVSFYAVDRPLATFAHNHLKPVGWFVWLTYIPVPLLPIASLTLVAVAVNAAVGAPLGRVGDSALRCSISLTAATVVKDQLKYVFGRTWPETWIDNNSSFFGSGAYGLHFFHGGAAYASFPSGHTTAIFSVAAVLWIRWPRFRPLYALVAGLVVVGLFGANYHWISDMIAGAYLGTLAGLTAAAVGGRTGGSTEATRPSIDSSAALGD